MRPTLLTLDSLRDSGWPREALEDLATMPVGLNREQMQNTVTWMARGRQFNRIVALDAGQLETAADLREHMRIPGMGITTAGYYRDRLAMRISARESGFAEPEFCRVLNYDELREFMGRVPAPWVLMPRTAGPGKEQHRIDDPEELWHVLEELGDRQSHYLLEEAVEGERFTVESIVNERRVIFSVVHHHRGWAGRADASATETVDRASRDWTELIALNGGLAPSLGMVRGITQASFVRSPADGRYLFEGIEATAGGEGADRLTEAATNLNLWREWARLEIAHLRGQDYVPNEWFEHYAMSLRLPAGLLPPEVPELQGVEIWRREQTGVQEEITLRSAWLEKLAQVAGALEHKLAAE
ncbi:MAG: ATPase [Terracidiphilus sp.]|nr:ATPase [Terracidiphilus sp.]